MYVHQVPNTAVVKGSSLVLNEKFAQDFYT